LKSEASSILKIKKLEIRIKLKLKNKTRSEPSLIFKIVLKPSELINST